MGERCVGRVDWEGKRGQNLCFIMYRFRILLFRKSPCGGRHTRKERWDTHTSGVKFSGMSTVVYWGRTYLTRA